jgi:hypothetical protein
MCGLIKLQKKTAFTVGKQMTLRKRSVAITQRGEQLMQRTERAETLNINGVSPEGRSRGGELQC